MNLAFSKDELAFRDQVRQFLADRLSPELRAAARACTMVFDEPEVSRIWQRILHEQGWLAYHWPEEHGGPGWTPVQRYIFEKECALAGAPNLPGMGLRLLAPVLQNFGTTDQQQRYLPAILSGEHYWCQGFSEPDAGSDLAALKTKAVLDGDRYLVSGSKLWTTHAHHADHMFCLARTNQQGKPQQGLSFLLIDMRQPGVEVQPIIGLAGDHEVNAVFLDNVAVPRTDRVGEEGEGWRIAKFLLENERGGTCFAPALLAKLDRLRAQLQSRQSAAPHQNSLMTALAGLELEAQALETLELRILAEVSEGRVSGARSSTVKLVASELRQRMDRLDLEAQGVDGLILHGLPDEQQRPPISSYLNGRAWTIFGGTSEIQKTIIARELLR